MHISTPAHLSARADVPYVDMDAYYDSVPSCARVCEQNYWSKYVKSAKCTGDGTDFACFCQASILAASVMNDTGMRGLCITQGCRSDSDSESAEAAVVGIAMYCALVSYAGTADTIPDTGNVGDLKDIVTVGTGTGTGIGTGAGTSTGTGTGTGTGPAPGSDSGSGTGTTSSGTSIEPADAPGIITIAGNDTAAGGGIPMPNSKAASSFSPSKSLLVLGSLLVSLAVFGNV